MARIPRLIASGEKTVYHVISRTALPGYPLEDIDLNPVRAGIVERPEEYRWNSIGYHIQTNNHDDLLCLDFGLEEFGVKGDEERLKRYRRYLYEKGGKEQDKEVKIEKRIIEKERKRDFQISLIKSISAHFHLNSSIQSI